MHVNRRVMISAYRRFVGKVTDWFEVGAFESGRSDEPLAILAPRQNH